MLIKTNPLPPGYYWVDYDPKSDGGKAFIAWLQINKSKVISRTTEMITAGDPWYTVTPTELWQNLNLADRVWALFQVLQPVDWPARDFGFWPNSTPKGTATIKADTVQTPDPPKPFDPKDLMWAAFWMGLAFYGVTQIPKMIEAARKDPK